MQRDDVVLYADGGDMTVGRRSTVYTYGNFQVIIPDDREQEEGDDRLQEGYISRPTERPTGRFDIGFVRADTTIDLNAGTSDLESVIDAAQKRTEGDIFFERDISGRGLGRYRIGVDFDTDDVVQVQVWGKRLPLPVTSTEIVVSEGDGSKAQRVHVGGQLVADAEALRKHNDDLLQQISSEKRQRLKEVGAVRRTATTAKDTAETALAAVQDADGEFQTRLEETRRLIEEGREHASKIEGHVAEAGRLAGDADRYAREAVSAADQADQVLASIEGDAEAVRAALIQIGGLHEQVRQNVTAAQEAVAEGQGHAEEAARQVGLAQTSAGNALDYAREAGLLVDEAEVLNESISGMATQIEGLVAEGNLASEAAQAAATAAQGHVSTAQDAVTEAQGLLSSTGDAAESAQSALQQARDELAVLDNVDGDGLSLTALLARVVSLHQQTLAAHDDTLTKHGQVLSAHSGALQAVSDAAAQASTAAAEAGDAAQSVLDAQAVQRDINGTQKQINDLYARAIRAAAASGAQAGVAAMQAAMAAQEAKDAAQAALDAAATNADSISLLADADELLETAIESNTDAIGKLRDANTLMNEAIREAAAAANSAGQAAASSGAAASEAGNAAKSSLEATAVLSDTVEARDQAQAIVDRQQSNTLVLHDNQLKWSRWSKHVFRSAFSKESGGSSTTNSVSTGMIDLELNNIGGHGLTLIIRPGWAGNYLISYERMSGGAMHTMDGTAQPGRTVATSHLIDGTEQIRYVQLYVWPEWGTEPREYALTIDSNNGFAYTAGYENAIEGNPMDFTSGTFFRFRNIDVIADDKVQVIIGSRWGTIPSGDIIGRRAYIRPAPVDERSDDLVVFTEYQGQVQWEPGAPIQGQQELSIAAQTLGTSAWRTVASWTGLDWTGSVIAAIGYELRFLNHNRISSNEYVTRILLNGQEVSRIGRNSFGGMNMYFAHNISETLRSGDRLEFQAYSSAGFTSERRVGSGTVFIVWG